MKPGYKTTEFWITVAVSVGSITGALAGVLPKQWALVAVSISASAYAISRALAKS